MCSDFTYAPAKHCGTTMNSTRRFFFRPASVALSPIGKAPPKPEYDTYLGGLDLPPSAAEYDSEEERELARLDAAEGAADVVEEVARA